MGNDLLDNGTNAVSSSIKNQKIIQPMILEDICILLRWLLPKNQKALNDRARPVFSISSLPISLLSRREIWLKTHKMSQYVTVIRVNGNNSTIADIRNDVSATTFVMNINEEHTSILTQLYNCITNILDCAWHLRFFCADNCQLQKNWEIFVRKMG